ncbi:MAG: YkgJ family cysteine cluster protein [Bacteriovoracaceae bacterium]|nr:YkgJ family cysteine cluster protein [Bacteriovoracaceae bacterium]
MIFFPAIAYKTYEKLKDEKSFKKLFKQTKKKLRLLSSSILRAELTHKLIDLEVKKLFDDPVVKENVSCKKSCSACCHTQVSVTKDEAELLATKVIDGSKVDLHRLRHLAEAGNESSLFYMSSYEQRACPFLSDEGNCEVYEDRPSVCRTNHVVSEPSLCETKQGVENPVRLLNTFKADMIIMAAFKTSQENGSLPFMLWKALKRRSKSTNDQVVIKA